MAATTAVERYTGRFLPSSSSPGLPCLRHERTEWLGTTGCHAQEPGGVGKGQVHIHICLQAASPDTGCQKGEMAWELARDDCIYFSSTLFIENVQTCECEINVLNSLWAPGIK